MSPPAKPLTAPEELASEAVLVSEIIPATRERIFTAWMNSDQHSAFTGDVAVIDPVVGGRHSSLAGHVSGTTMTLEPFRRIVQTWRSRDFPKSSPDSLLEITLEETVGGTLLTLLHSEIPTGLSDRCREAWLLQYLEPLKRFFTGRISNGVHAADKKALARPRKRLPTPAAGTAKTAASKRAAAKRKAARRPKVLGKASKSGRTGTTGRKARAGRPTSAARDVASRASTAKGRAASKPAKKAGAGKTAGKRSPAARTRALPTRRGQTSAASKRGKIAKSGKAAKPAKTAKSGRKPRR
jgi:uncharacterized protein YndB with AHSA1/START domain